MAINQVANVLEKNKLVEASKDKNDSRKRMLKLSKNGQTLVNELEPVWTAVDLAVKELFQQAGSAFINEIAKVEEQLDKNQCTTG